MDRAIGIVRRSDGAQPLVDAASATRSRRPGGLEEAARYADAAVEAARLDGAAHSGPVALGPATTRGELRAAILPPRKQPDLLRTSGRRAQRRDRVLARARRVRRARTGARSCCSRWSARTSRGRWRSSAASSGRRWRWRRSGRATAGAAPSTQRSEQDAATALGDSRGTALRARAALTRRRAPVGLRRVRGRKCRGLHVDRRADRGGVPRGLQGRALAGAARAEGRDRGSASGGGRAGHLWLDAGTARRDCASWRPRRGSRPRRSPAPRPGWRPHQARARFADLVTDRLTNREIAAREDRGRPPAQRVRQSSALPPYGRAIAGRSRVETNRRRGSNLPPHAVATSGAELDHSLGPRLGNVNGAGGAIVGQPAPDDERGREQRRRRNLPPPIASVKATLAVQRAPCTSGSVREHGQSNPERRPRR